MGRVIDRECTEWQGIMAMDAIGRANADESRELAEHLEHCEECRGDAADVRSAASALTLLDGAQVEALEWDAERWPSPAGAFAEPVSPVPAFQPSPAPHSVEGPGAREQRTRRRWMAGAGAAIGAVAAAVVALLLVNAPSAPTTTVALTGTKGVVATVSLTTQSWGTKATLRESGQAAGQVLTVWMKDASGHWWVAGSYRTTDRTGTVEVPLVVRRPAWSDHQRLGP